jgi:hypothetical protein
MWRTRLRWVGPGQAAGQGRANPPFPQGMLALCSWIFYSNVKLFTPLASCLSQLTEMSCSLVSCREWIHESSASQVCGVTHLAPV